MPTTMSEQEQRAPSASEIEAIARATLALAACPNSRAHLGNVVLIVEEYADDETLDALGIEDPYDLTGVYHGRPVGEKSSMEFGRAARPHPPLSPRDPRRMGGGWRGSGDAGAAYRDSRGRASFRADATPTCTGWRTRREPARVPRRDVRARRAGAVRGAVVRARTWWRGARHRPQRRGEIEPDPHCRRVAADRRGHGRRRSRARTADRHGIARRRTVAGEGARILGAAR